MLKYQLLIACCLLVVLTARSAPADELPGDPGISGAAGPYTIPRWKMDQPGCRYEDGVTEGRLAVITTDNTNWLRVTCAAGKIGPAEGGCTWRWPLAQHDVVELDYKLRFSQDFEFVKGGKLPGLMGGPESVTGGQRPTGTNGFSARVMWRREGRGEVYVYHLHQPGKYGESFPFPDDFRFPRDEPVRVRLRVAMNTPGQRDGKVQVWIGLREAPERLLVERGNLAFRTDASFGVDGLVVNVFHGGGDPSFAPMRDCAVDLTGFQLRKPGAETK